MTDQHRWRCPRPLTLLPTALEAVLGRGRGLGRREVPGEVCRRVQIVWALARKGLRDTAALARISGLQPDLSWQVMHDPVAGPARPCPTRPPTLHLCEPAEQHGPDTGPAR